MTQGHHAQRPKKIAVIGFGNIGQELFENLTRDGVADEVVVWNRQRNGEEDRWQTNAHKAYSLSIDQKNRIFRDNKELTSFRFTHDLGDALSGADTVVVTVGKKRESEDQSRMDLAKANVPLVDMIADAAKQYAPDANYIMATNPVDSMTQLFQQKSGIAHEQVMGLSGQLDRTRMAQSLSFELNKYADQHGMGQIKPEDIKNIEVVGQHGPNMVPVLSKVVIDHGDGRNPVKLTELLKDSPEVLEAVTKATVGGGGVFAKLIEASDHRAPAAALQQMVHAVNKAKFEHPETAPVLYTSTFDRDRGVYLGQRVEVQQDGTHRANPDKDLSHSEQAGLSRSEAACKKDIDEITGGHSHDKPRKPGEELEASAGAAHMASKSPAWTANRSSAN